MDANTVIQAISNVGFPIAAFLLMWYQCNTVVKENTAAITEMRVALDDIKKGDRHELLYHFCPGRYKRTCILAG